MASIDEQMAERKALYMPERNDRLAKIRKEGLMVPLHDFSGAERVMAPEFMNEQQKECWIHLADLFVECGIITTADLPALSIAAIGYAIVMDRNKRDTLRITAICQVFKLFVKFGCVPTARKPKHIS